MHTLPKVSILCLSYNHESYIEQSLNSIIAQDYENLEIFFWDNNSKDNSFKVASKILETSNREFVAIHSEQNVGVPSAFNRFLEKCSGEYISVLAMDDWVTKDCISKKVELYERNKDVGLIYSDGYKFIEDKDELIPIESPYPNKEFLFEDLLKENFLHTKGMLVMKSVFDKVGIFDESIPIEDWDMSLRIAKEFPIKHIKEKQFYYRMHISNFSSKPNSNYFIAILDTLYKHREHSNYKLGIDSAIPSYIAALKKEGKLNTLALKRIVKYAGIRRKTLYHILNQYKSYHQLKYYNKRVGTLIKQLFK